jgi:hypothetical protein
MHQIADKRIDLTQAERRLRAAFQIAPHETVLGYFHLKGRTTGFIQRGDSILSAEG